MRAAPRPRREVVRHLAVGRRGEELAVDGDVHAGHTPSRAAHAAVIIAAAASANRRRSTRGSPSSSRGGRGGHAREDAAFRVEQAAPRVVERAARDVHVPRLGERGRGLQVEPDQPGLVHGELLGVRPDQSAAAA